MKRIQLRLWLLPFLFLICCLWTQAGEGAGIEPLRWGMTLEELTQVLSKGGISDSILREEQNRSVIELPYTPLKSLKISRGGLTALVEVKKTAGPESIGKLFGYAYEGRIFGLVELFKQTTWSSPSEITRALKERFPEGKVFRIFAGPKTVSYFEYRGNDLYVFTNEEGVYYFEPLTLDRVIREGQKVIEGKDSKFQEETRDKLRLP